MTYWNYIKQQCQVILDWIFTLNSSNITTTAVIITLMLLGWLTLNFIVRYLDQTNVHQESPLGTNDDLIIYSNKQTIITALPICLYVCTVLYFLLRAVNYINYSASLIFFAKGALILLVGMFLIGVIIGLYQLNSNEPIAILNKEGIWLKEYNFIPWDCINTVDTYQLGETPMEMIRIDVLDTKTVHKHAYFSGKIRMFWAKLFRYPLY